MRYFWVTTQQHFIGDRGYTHWAVWASDARDAERQAAAQPGHFASSATTQGLDITQVGLAQRVLGGPKAAA